MEPKYNLDKIKYGTDEPTWYRAIGLYKKNKVKQFEELADGFSAVVKGTSDYQVFVSAKHYDHGSCECYLGQNDTLCKHMVAVAMYAVKRGSEISREEETQNNVASFSGRIEKLSEAELEVVKRDFLEALRHIKAYTGPSKHRFAYQNSLDEGCNRMANTVSKLPASPESAELLVNLLLQLDKKLVRGGVDDSDGTVGNFIADSAAVLEKFVEADSECVKAFTKLRDIETCFGWEEPLVKLYDETLSKRG